MFKNKLIWAGPISVMAFVVLLAVMYGWVGKIESVGGETPERPEARLAQQVQIPIPPAGQPGPSSQLAHHGQFPAGIGNNRIQLINTPTYPSGIGSAPNNQIQLINTPTYPSGIGSGPNSQIQLIKTPAYPSGIGSAPNNQIRLIGQNQPARPYLGVNVGEIPGAVAAEQNVKPGTGVYVKSMAPGSPAEKAGLKAGDVILKCDHQTLTSHEQIGRILRTKKAGDVIKLVVKRNKIKKSFHVKLENTPNGLVKAAAVHKPTWMGASIQDIDAVMKLQFKLPDKRGVIVSHVDPGSPAQNAGMTTGDVIRRFDGKRIIDVGQLQKAILKQQPGKQVQLTILRQNKNITLPVIMGQKSAAAEKIPFLGPADMAIEGSWIGMDVGELSANGASGLGLPAGTRGILVNDVESPPATMVGFQTGDVISVINGMATPDMKHFVAATKQQTGAVVDVIRGNKHLFISVPPPGFTQQGTRINTGANNKFRQVALTGRVNGRLAILAAGPDLNASVIGNTNQVPYVILVDLNQNAYAALNFADRTNLAGILQQHNIAALICSDIAGQSARDLSARGITLYSGVVGTANDALSLYEAGSLVAMQ